MSFKWFDWFSWLVGLFFSFFFFVVVSHLVWPVSLSLTTCVPVGGIFVFDLVSFFLVLLSCFVGVSLFFWFQGMSFLSKTMIGVSLFSSFLCYCCVHSLWFWVFYELSIVSLLVLLVVDSPYSERYIASWYLLGYVVVTSLPMLLCLLYISGVEGCFDIRFWCGDNVPDLVYFVLALTFITKIPLLPFHVWLPIVHAEAGSAVSVCLSGYIMKLGILGVFRFCFSLVPDYIFSTPYTLVCFFFSLLFFLAASRELDGKRWLAFMSLSHILVALGCLCVGEYWLGGVGFLYCLGHGLSASVTFLFLWLLYEVSGTRNLILLKGGVSGSLLLRVICCSCFCTVCSLPPTVQFFSEVSLVLGGGYLSVMFLVVFYFFLFLGGLVPLFVVGGFLSRHCDLVSGFTPVYGALFSLFFLIFWSFFLFSVC